MISSMHALASARFGDVARGGVAHPACMTSLVLLVSRSRVLIWSRIFGKSGSLCARSTHTGISAVITSAFAN